MKEGKNQGRDEKYLGGFSDVIAVDNNVFAEHENAAQEHDQFLDADDDDRGPGENADERLADHGGDDHHLIGQGIKEFAEIRNLIQLPGEHSVKHVGDACHGENDQRGDFVPVMGRTEKNDHKNGNQKQADHGQDIGNVPDIGKQFTDTVFQDVQPLSGAIRETG